MDIKPIKPLALEVRRKPNGFWKNKNTIVELAKKYESLKDFRENESKAYRAAIRSNLVAFLQKKYFKSDYGHRYKRKIYTILFSDSSVYIGISYNPIKRIEQHKKFSYFKKKFKQKYQLNISKKCFSPTEAQTEEKRLIKRYLKNRSFFVLNLSPGGCLGGNVRKWTRDAVLKEISKHSILTEFIRKSPGAYQAAIAMGLRSLIYKKLKNITHSNGHWTKQNIKNEANKYKTLKKFMEKSNSAYVLSGKLGIRSEVTSHMKRSRKQNNFWTKEKIFKEAKKHKTLIEFVRKSAVANMAAKKLGIIEEITSHMKRNNRWTEHKIIERVMILNSKNDFLRSKALYLAAWNRKMIPDIYQYYEDLKSIKSTERNGAT